jgi:hypothetical protein
MSKVEARNDGASAKAMTADGISYVGHTPW